MLAASITGIRGGWGENITRRIKDYSILLRKTLERSYGYLGLVFVYGLSCAVTEWNRAGLAKDQLSWAASKLLLSA